VILYYLVVQVKDPRDPLTGLGGYEQRFTFPMDDTDLAWKCYSDAMRNGFEASCERVMMPTKEESRVAE
jgi:hypothetical protein